MARGVIRATASGHIASPSLAESLQSHDKMLKREMLSKGLERRASIEELKARNILRDSKTCGRKLWCKVHLSALQNLERKQKANALESALTRRATLEEVLEKGIMSPEAVTVSPRLAPSATALAASLQRRSTVDELKAKNILRESTGGGKSLWCKVHLTAMQNLEKKQKVNALESALSRRPTFADIVEKSILSPEKTL